MDLTYRILLYNVFIRDEEVIKEADRLVLLVGASDGAGIVFDLIRARTSSKPAARSDLSQLTPCGGRTFVGPILIIFCANVYRLIRNRVEYYSVNVHRLIRNPQPMIIR